MSEKGEPVAILCMLMKQDCERMKTPERVSKKIIKQIVEELELAGKGCSKRNVKGKSGF